MRVLFVSHSAPFREGGVETRSRETAKRLVSLGHEVIYLCAKTQPGELSDEVRDGIRIVRKKVLPDSLLKRFPFPHYFTLAAANALMMIHLLLFLQREKVDCVREEFAPVPISGLLAFRRLKGVRRVAVLHTLPSSFRAWLRYFGPIFGIYGYFMAWCFKNGILRFDRVIVTSRWCAAHLQPFPRVFEKLSVVPNGVDRDFFSSGLRRMQKTQGPISNMVTVGRMVKLKGQRYLFEALAALKDRYPSLKLTVLGKGPLQKGLMELAKRLGIEDRIDLVDALPHASIPEFFGSFDLLVMPSLHEGFNVTLLEAMACGLPALISDIAGFADIADSTAATFFHSRDSKHLAEQLDWILRHPEVARERAQRAMQVVQRWDWDEVTHREMETFSREPPQNPAPAATGQTLSDPA